ncbi:MAG: NAD(P)H-hydrate dehydratase [Gemmatimonadales bacterium]
MSVCVASAAETVACERTTMATGITPAELMSRAGTRAAGEILDRRSDRLDHGASIFVGSGNNGGDGWVVAESLCRAGIITNVIEVAPPRSPECTKARVAAISAGATVGERADEQLIVDALLGTGSSGAPRGEIAAAIARIAERRAEGAYVIAVDVPSGLDATTGAREGAAVADLTLTFGTVKRGQLISRGNCGNIVALDIGLADDELMMSLPVLVDRNWVSARIPPIPLDAHKGIRKRLSVVGGGSGMAGATILCGEGALRSGIGLLRIVAAEANAVAIHSAIPAALFQKWPSSAAELEKLAASADVIAIGPGLGSSLQARDLVERILSSWSGPVVIDADGLNVFAGDLDSLAELLGKRPAIITPHPVEMGRLIGLSTEDVLANRFDAGTETAKKLGCAVLLKGTPTVIFSPDGSRLVSASGTAALATGGSGDVLTGIASTLLAQMLDARRTPAESAACAAFIHGRAAELCAFVRGTTLDDILAALPAAWNEPSPEPRAGVLAEVSLHS